MDSAATPRLYDATLKRNLPSFLKLLEEDPLILQRCMIENSGRFIQSPLHVAANLGHTETAIEILNRMPELAEVVDQTSRNSPLHVASAKGYLEIVENLLTISPRMCLARDQDGHTPIHVAAMKGQVDVLQVLHRSNEHAAHEKSCTGETILHLCVKHSQLTALMKLVELNDDGDQLLNSKDKNGNTILHLAVIRKQSKIVDYLLKNSKIEKNAMNNKEMTAVDIHLRQNQKGFEDEEIKQLLNRAKAKPAKDALHHQAENIWLESQRSALMVVASLIATMAFQAGINPPGGLWQDTKAGHAAGTAIWSYDHKDKTYNVLLVSNTIGLISSLSVILILVSGLPCKRRFLPFLRITLWIAVMATSISYLFSVSYVTADDKNREQTLWNVLRFGLIAWIVVVAMVFLGHVVQLILKVTGWHRRESMKNRFKDLLATMRNKNVTNNFEP